MTNLEIVLTIFLAINLILVVILFIENKSFELDIDSLKYDYKCFIQSTLTDLRYAKHDNKILDELYDKVYKKYWKIK